MPATPGSDTTAASQLARVTQVAEPPNIAYGWTPQCWNYHGQTINKYFHFADRLTALRLDLNTTQASTLEADLEDDDFTVLSNELFANWAFNIEDVSLDSARKFNSNKLKAHTDNAYLGDESDLEWVLGQRPIDTVIGNVYYRLCAINSGSQTVTLQFEDRAASYLRAQTGALSWDRSQHTRAQFVAMLCKQAGCDFFIPELTVTQPLLAQQQTGSSLTTSPTVSSKGLASDSNLTVKGSPMNKNPTQMKTATSICQIGDKLGAPIDAIAAVLFDCIYESGMGSDPSNHGILGGVSADFASNHSSDTAEITAAFKGGSGYNSAISLAKQYPGQVAMIGVNCTHPSSVPGVLLPQNSQYQGEVVPGGIEGTVGEAEAIVAAFGGVAEVQSNTTKTTSSNTSYAFTRGPNEDSFDCIQRLAQEVGWYAFVRQNQLWFVSGNYLFSQDSQLTAECGVNGVTFIDVDLDMGARDQTAEVDIYAKTELWTALPGMMVSVRNRGPATGKWMVSEVAATLLDPTQLAEITCYKPVPKMAEPVDNTSTTVGSGGVLSAGLATATEAFFQAKQLSNKKLLYPPGDVEPAGVPRWRTVLHLPQVPQGATMYDCSASVSEVLALAGFKLPGGITFGGYAPVSGAFVPGAAGLLAGPGKQMTIWANAGHIFIEFNIPNAGHFQANTNVSGDNAGFRVGPWGPMGSVDAAGGTFQALHYPGT